MLENGVYAIFCPRRGARLDPVEGTAKRSGEAAELMKLTAPAEKAGGRAGNVREPEGGATGS